MEVLQAYLVYIDKWLFEIIVFLEYVNIIYTWSTLSKNKLLFFDDLF